MILRQLISSVGGKVFKNYCRTGSGLDRFGSNSKVTKRVTLLVRGRCYLNNLSLKIALPARVNKVSREFASKDLLDCYGVV